MLVNHPLRDEILRKQATVHTLQYRCSQPWHHPGRLLIRGIGPSAPGPAHGQSRKPWATHPSIGVTFPQKGTRARLPDQATRELAGRASPESRPGDCGGAGRAAVAWRLSPSARPCRAAPTPGWAG